MDEWTDSNFAYNLVHFNAILQGEYYFNDTGKGNITDSETVTLLM